MKLSSAQRVSAAAFSLVEVALAMGLASFCLVAVMGLVPLGVDTGQLASDQAAASSILTHVLGDLRATPVTSPPGVSTTSAEYGIVFPSNTTSTVPTALTFYFGGVTDQYSAPTQFSFPRPQPVASPPAGSRYRLTVSFLAPTGGRTATEVSLLVSWPAQVDPANSVTGTPIGRVQTFAALDRN